MSICIYISIFGSVLVLYVTKTGRTITKKISKTFDEDTVTPSDYVLHLHLTPEQSAAFDKFYDKKLMEEKSEIPRGQIFVKWLL